MKKKVQKTNYRKKIEKRARVARVLGYPSGTPFPAMGIMDSNKPFKPQIQATGYLMRSIAVKRINELNVDIQKRPFDFQKVKLAKHYQGCL